MKILIATDGSEFSKAAAMESCKYFTPDTAEVLIVSSYEDAAPIAAEPFAISAEYYQKLEDAVRIRTAGVVPGMLLSGGLGSASVLALAAALDRRPALAVSVTNGDEGEMRTP